MDAPAKKCKKIDFPEYTRGHGRPRKSWSKVIRHDLKTLSSMDDMAQDRKLWKSRIKVVDFQVVF